MPKVLERMVEGLKKAGKPESNAFAIATSQLQKQGKLKPGTNKATAKGVAAGRGGKKRGRG